MSNILKQANDIINLRKEEKERQYGPIGKEMEKAAEMASLLTNKELTAVDMFKAMIAIKLTRESHKYKEDNLLDAVAYIGALNNYMQDNEDLTR